MRINIKDLVDEKFPNPNQFVKAMGMERNSVIKLYHGDVSLIRLTTLTKICEVLDCTPNDILK